MTLKQNEMRIVKDHRIELKDKALLIHIGRLISRTPSVDAILAIREDISKYLLDQEEPEE